MAFTFLVIQSFYSVLVFFVNILIWYIMLCCSIKYNLLGNQLRRMGMVKKKGTKTPEGHFPKRKSKTCFNKTLLQQLNNIRTHESNLLSFYLLLLNYLIPLINQDN